MLSRIKSILKHKGHLLFDRPYELNIVGLRSKQTKPNRFDDEIHVFFKTSKKDWEYHIFKATTDPGTYWLNHPMQIDGTAILKEGQYRNAYMIGLHKGQYSALVQKGPVVIHRDYNRNSSIELGLNQPTKGYFGINIHRARSGGSTPAVDRWSAGCQVFQNAEEFDRFLGFCERHQQLYGNLFTYTLIDFRAVKRENIRRLFMAGASILLGITGLIVYAYEEPKKQRRSSEESHKMAA